MDNQLFPGGALDDGPQMCAPCGIVFNNSLTYQHHMRLHFLPANNPMLINQPAADTAWATGIMDLIGGVSMAMSSSGGMPLVPPQAVFSGAVGSTHLISPGVGLVTAPVPNIGLPHQLAARPPKEKKQRPEIARTVISASVTSTAAPNIVSQQTMATGASKARSSSGGAYLSTFPKDLQKADPVASKSLNVPIVSHSVADAFPSSSQQLPVDPLEAFILTSPVKSSAPAYERQSSRKSNSSPHDTLKISKDSKKLFQPFVSADVTVSSGYGSRDNLLLSSEGLMPSSKTATTKTIVSDILSTPQKASYVSSSENMYTSAMSQSSTKSGDGGLFGMFLDSDIASVPTDRKADVPVMTHQHDDDLTLKSHFFPGLVDPLTISPSSSQSSRKGDTDQLVKIPVPQSSLDHSPSTSPVSHSSVSVDPFTPVPDVSRSATSPKLSSAPLGGLHDSSSNPAMMHMFRGPGIDVLPSSTVSAIKPQGFGNSGSGITNSVSSVSNPSVDITVNPLGTGYFNVLMQKMIDPNFSLSTDIDKPNTSNSSGGDGVKGKITIDEKGLLINDDYDKISDTEEEDFPGFMDGIDSKTDCMDASRYNNDLDDILNELSSYGDKHPEVMKGDNQTEDFIKGLIEEPTCSKSVVGPSLKTEDTFNPLKEFEVNTSIISEVLEQEKEKIERESKERENERLNANAMLNITTTTSSSVTVWAPSVTNSITTVSNTESKVSTSVESSEKKDEDPVDFEIPKVGKLMKIRKYFEIQEQKRKEQTEKETEVRIHAKPEPVVHEKPQTILVQVSKRKKVEYGPYFNRQSLLEGKPKASVESASPQKTPRPKPKPVIPEKRTFNLRERKTKTDFATLASTGSRTAENKKSESKSKSDSSEKVNKEKEQKAESQEEKDEKQTSDIKDTKKVARSQEKKEDISVETKPTTRRNSAKSENEEEKDNVNEGENTQSDIKSSLRTRSAKTDNENVEAKNLRKRSLKTCSQNTVAKVKKKEKDSTMSEETHESEEKATRSKVKQKTAPDTSTIKKCSVNLGEKLTDSKSKSILSTGKSDIKVGSKEDEAKGSAETNFTSENETGRKETEGRETDSREIKSSKIDKDIKKQQIQVELEDSSSVMDRESDQKSKAIDTVDGDFSTVGKEEVKANDTETRDKKESKELKTLDTVSGKMDVTTVRKTERKLKSNKTFRKESNIFDTIDKTDFQDSVKASSADVAQIVTVTSGNSEKKLTLKLKLGPNFQKAFELFDPKKRKYENTVMSKDMDEKVTEKKQKITDEKGEKMQKTNDEKDIMATLDKTDKPEKMDAQQYETRNIESKSLNLLKDVIKSEEEMGKEYELSRDGEKEDFKYTTVKEVETPAEPLKQYASAEMKDFSYERQKMAQELVCSQKVVKHSVENEFQRLVNEAKAEAQKEGFAGKQERSLKLRKRMNENIRYNVDESDDELNLLPVTAIAQPAVQKGGTKNVKTQIKSLPVKNKLKSDAFILKESESSRMQQPKKDVDVYDFTDTEMSDNEETTPKKLDFKPKYVSNLNLFGQKKPNFVSKSVASVLETETESVNETLTENTNGLESQTKVTENVDTETASSEISYVGKTIEPLKIKLSMIKLFKEKKHKHKKKKKKKEKERKNDLERYDSESVDSESRDSFSLKNSFEDTDIKQDGNSSEMCPTGENLEIKKTDDVGSVESASQESNTNSVEMQDDEQSESSSSTVKCAKRPKVKEKKHICEYCNVGFGQKCDLRRHVMIHTGERPYPCGTCEKRFQRKTDLAKHVRIHTGEKPFACEFCDKRVSDKSQLLVHRRLHTGDRPYCCEKCGKRCITSSELSRHKLAHCSSKLQKCTLCKKEFSVKECFGMHMKLHYRSRSKAFKCEKCAIGFDRKSDLDSHHCVDPSENLYICSECYEEFTDEMLYAEHIKTHDLGVLACNVCTVIFEDKHSLETHLCSLGMEKQKMATCDICNAEFQDQEILKKHRLSHKKDEEIYTCDHCPEVFTIPQDLIVHQKLHFPALQKSVNTTAITGQLKHSSSDSASKEEDLGSFREQLGDTVTVKKEIDSGDFEDIKASQSSSCSKFTSVSTGVKSELDTSGLMISGNSHRASVISGTFRVDDDTDSHHSSSHTGRVPLSKQNSAENFNNKSVKSSSLNIRTQASSILDNERFFEPSDFTNSPDFSTLTDDNEMDIDSFSRISDALRKSVDRDTRTSTGTEKQIDPHASVDIRQKILKQFETTAQNSNSIPVSEISSTTTSQGAVRRNSSGSNSRISALLSSNRSNVHSSNISQLKSRQAELLAGLSASSQTGQYPSSLGKNLQSKQWSGFQMSASDFVDSFLTRDPKASSGAVTSKVYKSDQPSHRTSGGTLIVQSRPDFLNKDNLENQLHSEILSSLQMNSPVPKTDLSFETSVAQTKYGTTTPVSATSTFHGLNSNLYSSGQFYQSFNNKTDFGAFPHNVQSTSSFSASANNSYLSSFSLTDLNKRQATGVYGGDTHTDSFYLSRIDESMKDLTDSDKAQDETAALLSNFDQY